MKAILSFLILSLPLFAVSPHEQADDVIRELKSWNVPTLGEYFDSKVDVNFPGQSATASMPKAEAIAALQQFTVQNGIKTFELSSQREAGLMYITGKLTGGTKSYNITILLKTRDSQHRIITLRIS